MTKNKTGLFERIEHFLVRNFIKIMTLTALSVVGVLFWVFDWYGVVGIFLLKSGLGLKVGAAKTFGAAFVKAGGYKVVAGATTGVLAKRFMIDKFQQNMNTHFISRWKNNAVALAKKQFSKIKTTSAVVKIQALIASILSIPAIYFIWTKVLGVAIQKFLYKLALPIGLFIWTMIIESMSFITNFITFAFQLVVINFMFGWLDKFTLGRKFLSGMRNLISFIANIFDNINSGFKIFGFDPKHYVALKAIAFNLWLQDKLDSDLNARNKLIVRRARRLNPVEAIALKRKCRTVKKEKKRNLMKKAKMLFKSKVLKHKTWKEKRADKKVNPILAKRKVPNGKKIR